MPRSPPPALLSVPLAQDSARLASASLQDACKLGVGLQLVLDVLQECLGRKALVSRSPENHGWRRAGLLGLLRALDHIWLRDQGSTPLLMISHFMQPTRIIAALLNHANC